MNYLLSQLAAGICAGGVWLFLVGLVVVVLFVFFGGLLEDRK